MSYILDALKRAESERQRGAAPDLLASPAAAVQAMVPPRHGTRPAVWIGTAGLAGAALWAAAWHGWTIAPPVATSTPQAAVATLQAPAATAQAPVATVQAPFATVQAPVVVAPAHVAAAQAPVLQPGPTAAAAARPLASASSSAAPRPATVAKAARARPAADTQGTAAPLALHALPENVRQRVAVLKLGGAMHSVQAANRLLIVDGQVVREGDEVAPGVVLEQIRPRSAIFRVQGLRAELPL